MENGKTTAGALARQGDEAHKSRWTLRGIPLSRPDAVASLTEKNGPRFKKFVSPRLDMRFRGLFWLLFGTVGFFVLAVQASPVWLPWIAQNLIVEDKPHSADLIAVFAYGEERAGHAARLYREGFAPRIVATGSLISKPIELFYGEKVTGAQLTAKFLTAAGVPEEAVVVLPKGTSTYEEGEAIKALVRKHGYRSLIAVSSPYHMRRVRATLSHLFAGTAIAVQYSPAQDADFSATEWWRRERDLIQVTNEYLKLFYYHLALF